VGETALTVAVLAFFGFRLATGAQFAASSEGRRRVGDIARGIRWRHIWPVPIVWTAVLAVALTLLQVPGLSWGWWSSLGGQGNPIIGGTDRATGTVFEWLIPLVFLTLLVPALPLFAMREEEIFRRGAQHWSNWKRLGKATVFGLVHAVVGIPIAVALALTIGGLYFTRAYLRAWRPTLSEREALLESARAHTAYNACIVVLAYVVVVWSAFS
jgi:hypothetical protein